MRIKKWIDQSVPNDASNVNTALLFDVDQFR